MWPSSYIAYKIVKNTCGYQEQAGNRKEVLEGILRHSGDIKSSTTGSSHTFLIGKVQRLLLGTSVKLNELFDLGLG
jgi:hypothetical protein